MNRLTPLEIQRASFPRKLQGIDADAVRELLSRVAEQVEEEARIRGELRSQVARLTQEVEDYRQRTHAVNEALVAAQRTAEATVARAEAEAGRTIGEAQALADRLIDDAIRRAENLELVISQLKGRRRSARADLKRIAELLGGTADDDASVEDREAQTPAVAVLRPRQRESKV
jgi:cell division initiation protein